MRSTKRLALLCGIAIATMSCGSSDSPTAATSTVIASVFVTASANSVLLGKTIALSAQALNASGLVVGAKTFVWATSASAIATVSTDGVVTAVGAGPVTVTATADGKTGSFSLTVAPVTLTVINGAGQSGGVGAFIGPKDPGFRVLDASGSPVAGVTIRFTPSNGGSVSAPSVITDANGEALVRWRLGSLPLQQTLRADLESLSTSITASARANFSILAGNNQSALAGNFVGPNDPAVRLTSLDGSPVAGAAVQFSPSGNGVVSPSSVTTDASGIGAFRWQLSTTAGANTLSARIGDSVVTMTGQGRLPVASISIGGSNGGPLAQPLTAEVSALSVNAYASMKDASGSDLSGPAVVWTLSDATLASVVDATSPVAKILGLVPGTGTLTATSEGKSASVSVLIIPAKVASFSLSMSPHLGSVPVSGTPYLREGQTVQFIPLLRDASGHILTGRTITWTSANPSIVQISSTGLATGGNDGFTTIAGVAEGVGATQPLVVVTYRLIVPSPIAVGDSVAAQLTNSNGGNPCNRGSGRASWSSSDTSVATTGPANPTALDSQGFVKGVSPGTATITAACFVGLQTVPANESVTITVVPKS